MDPLTMLGINAANQVIGSAMGLGLQGINDRRQLKQQQKLNEQQLQINQRMADYNQALALKTWKDTNYQAQTDEMRKAGLNVGLMYKGAGQGGVTMMPQGQVNAPHAPTGGGEIGMGIQFALMNQQLQANIELAKAQANKINVEATKIAGVDTQATQTSIQKMIAETTNEQVKTKLNEIQIDIANIEKSNKNIIQHSEIENIIQKTNQLKLQNGITSDSYDSIVMEIKQKAISAQLNNDLTKAHTSLTQTEINQIHTSIMQKWAELGLNQKSVDQKDIQLKIDQMEADTKREYPNAWQVAGGILKKAYNSLAQFEQYWFGGNVILK